ncbi:PD-(D/E)XK motif protein [Myroides marinus]|uniref:PD-(D/E)XK motif protein n=1 Tax=Myroides marinus TaxID=703342 RepID=UPI0025762074|nr:PD-(D/E)XK motif protein [Myroides marinus]MDM1503790.1 PD-(D/E)XK motif protein [Myroides marinus]
MINIKQIWETQESTSEIFTKTKINEIINFDCYLATNNKTKQRLYIMSVSQDIIIPDLKKYNFKSVGIFDLKLESNIGIYIYLFDNELIDIFTLFIQNILKEIINEQNEELAVYKSLNVISNWKKLFEKINFKGLTIEQQKGLIGELYFLKSLLKNEDLAPNAIKYWTSTEPGFESKDFTLNTIGAEIKFTTAKHPVIKITNERQLDKQYLDELFLILITANSVKSNGITLKSLVLSIRKMILTNDDLELFNQKLNLYGYYDEHADFYTNMYIIKEAITYQINNDFPKIQENQLSIGIHDISYSIEISAVKNFIVDQTLIIKKWKEL